MKVLILSSATGGGHNAAGAAVQEALLNAGHEAVMMDMFLLSSARTARLVGQTYVRIARGVPRLFGMLYRLGGFISSSRHKSPVYYANGLMAKKLHDYLEQNPYDAIVMPHLFPAETITYMKRHNMALPLTVAVATDYTCIPFWEETECDYYIIPHGDLTEEYTRRKMSADRLLPYGIPVKEAFRPKTDNALAKESLGLPPDKPMYLVMSGSMGFGKIHIFAYELVRSLKNGEHVVIICGNNKKLKRQLKRIFFHAPNVHIIGYTNNVADYMAACDVIYTKPGGLTTTEALNSNVPIVHTAPIPGCETKNREFFVSRGMSIAAEHIHTQIKQGRLLVENKEIRNGMQSAQKQNVIPDSAKKICEFLELQTAKAKEEKILSQK
ncbi:MAG: glycosyltransferase [Lachnospiraceae bacterium]|nr:glycosyltransferase [Lachnospiraceae bacterium]MBD5497403.1 glycosyltransferase [Lachnospiraceae bacterium]